jgi:uncharacterized protein
VNRGRRTSTIAAGSVFGFLITGSGFGNYATIHQALLLRSWYLFAVFGSAAAVAAGGLALLRGAGTTRYGGPLRLPHHRVRPRHLYGAAVFGAGFGLTGACPGASVAMVATGGLGGLLVLAGMVGGLWLRGVTERQTAPQLAHAVHLRLPRRRRGAAGRLRVLADPRGQPAAAAAGGARPQPRRRLPGGTARRSRHGPGRAAMQQASTAPAVHT